MAQERSITPEKQLLKLIEEPKDKGAAVKARAIKYRGLSLFSLGAWLGRFHFSKNKIRGVFDLKSLRRLDISAVNSALFLLVFILTFYFIYNLSVSVVNMRKPWDYKLKSDGVQGQGGESFEDASLLKKSESFYLEKVRERDIFKIGAKNIAGQLDTAVKEASSKAIEATQHLKLVGISWSGDPDAMIEDTKGLRTFFVKRGQMVGDVKIEAILKDKVILSYKGEEVELR